MRTRHRACGGGGARSADGSPCGIGTGEQIAVAPTGYRGNQVKIGIEAFKTCFTILRREVLERQRSTDPV